MKHFGITVGAAAALCCLGGCAASLSSGLARADDVSAAGSRLQVGFTRQRESGAVGGLAVRMEHHSAPVRATAGLARGGYLLQNDYGVGLEAAGEVGFGEPPRIEMEGSGFYGGGSLQVLIPIGAGARGTPVWETNRFYLVNTHFQVVIGADAGVWSMPAELGNQEYFEWALRAGLRVNLGSDAVTDYPAGHERTRRERAR
ncbi:MAG: hypothetical protein OXT09_27035 [Myxococcales bacterium]|nr:hypothetical protein [Myxococcales bacterium]